MCQPTPSSAPYFVQGDKVPCERLSDARVRAGILQFRGRRRSLPILQDGKVVDLKRF